MAIYTHLSVFLFFSPPHPVLVIKTCLLWIRRVGGFSLGC